MPLVPLDYNPFATGGGKLVPLDYDPFQSEMDTPNRRGTLHESMLSNAKKAMGADAPLLGIPKTLQAYVANSLQGLPLIGTATDEGMSGVGAAIGLGKGNNLKERYNSLQQDQQVLREAGGERSAKYSPGATTVGQLGAGLATLRFAPTLQIPAKAGGMLSGAAKGFGEGILNASAYGGSAGFGDTNSFLSDEDASALRAKNAKDSARGLAMVFGPLGAVGGSLAGRVAGREGNTGLKTAKDFKAEASASYKEADKLGSSLPAGLTNKYLNQSSATRPQTEAGLLTEGENEVTKLLDRWEALKDKPLSLRAVKEMDTGLGKLVQKYGYDSKTMKMNDEGHQLKDFQENLRQIMEEGDGEGFSKLKEAIAKWAQSARLGDIENLISSAKNMDQPAKAIASKFDTLRKRGMRGYNDAERKAIEKAAKTGPIVDLLRNYGSRLGAIGSTTLGGGLGFATGGPLGAAVGAGLSGAANWATSAAARKAAEALQMRKANKVLELIANRGRAIPKPNPIFQSIPNQGILGPSPLQNLMTVPQLLRGS